MVEINYKVIIVGMVCLTGIYVALLLLDKDNTTFGFAIIGTIAMAIGIVIPSPKVDNEGDILKW